MATRRSSHARRGGGTSLPAWLWLLSGVLIGIVLAGVAIYGGLAPKLQPQPTAPQPAAAPATAAGSRQAPEESAPTAGSRPRYEFYSVLPEMEVVIPDSELRERVRAETPAATGQTDAPATTASGVRYRLQAGSYRDPRPAEEAKARLALLGISATVQSVNINGSTYHRVYVGPYDSAAEVEQVKQQLAGSGVQAITVREQTQ